MPVNVLPRDIRGNAIGALRLAAPQAQEISATATTTSAVNCHVARISADIDVHWTFGTNATAATTDNFLPAKLVEYIRIVPGGQFSYRSATSVAAGALGTFYVSETI